MLIESSSKHERKPDPLLERVSADVKIFLNERTRVPPILSVSTYWSENTGIDRKGEFRVVISLAPGMVNLEDLVNIKYHAECDLKDITVVVEEEQAIGRYNEYRLVLEMPLEWWRHPLHEYGQDHIKSLVKDMQQYATKKNRPEGSDSEETQLDFPKYTG